MGEEKIGASPFTVGVFGPGGEEDIIGGVNWCVCPECGKRKQLKDGSTCQDIVCGDCDVVMAGGLFAGLKAKSMAMPCQLGVVKGKDGEDYWWMITGSAFRDLEEEIISRRAIDYSIRFSDLTGFRGEADLYHIDGTEWGNCLYQYRVDEVLVEAGSFKNNIFAQKVKRWLGRIGSGELDSVPGASVTFYYDPDFVDQKERVYDRVIIFKRALLWQEDAAFPWSTVGLAVKELSEGSMSKRDALHEILDDAELAERILEEGAEVSKNIRDQGIAFKDADADSETPEPEAGTEEVSEETLEETADKDEGVETVETEEPEAAEADEPEAELAEDPVEELAAEELEEEVVAEPETEVTEEAPVEAEEVPEAEVEAEPEAEVEVEKVEEKGSVSFQDLPLASEDRSWDAGAARKRLKTWAGGPDKDDVSWTKYRKAFLWYDSEDSENFGSYKFPVADVIDGSLKAVPAAISAAAGRLNQADIPADDKSKLRTHLGKYYKKMDKEPPWAEKQVEMVEMAPAAFGGATSIPEAQEYLDASDEEFEIWQSYNLFESVARNILNSDAIEDKREAMNEAIEDYQELLAVEKAKEADAADKDVETPEGEVVDEPSAEEAAEVAEVLEEPVEVEKDEDAPTEESEFEVVEGYIPALKRALGTEERDARLDGVELQLASLSTELVGMLTQLTEKVTAFGERMDEVETDDDERIEQKIRRLSDDMFRPTRSPEREDVEAREKELEAEGKAEVYTETEEERKARVERILGDLKPA